MKRILSLILSIVLMLSLVNMPVNAESASEQSLKLGDYITLGCYNGEDIVWRYVADDENGKLMLCDRVLCERMYYCDPNQFISTYMVDDWSNSAVRRWLNCDNTNDVWKKAYSVNDLVDWNEDGFLSNCNFTETEKKAIKPSKIKSALFTSVHTQYAPVTGDLEVYYSWSYRNLSENYTDYEFTGEALNDYNRVKTHRPVDNMFLLDVTQALSVHKNFGDYIIKDAPYWLRTKAAYTYEYLTIAPIDEKAAKVEKERGFEFKSQKCEEKSGIRPAFYLSEKSIILSGEGTRENPYRIDGTNEDGLQIGDYISFGSLEDNDIIWRYVADDENGKLFLSDKVLEKAKFSATWDTKWETSDIRCYLQTDFLNYAHIDADDERIIKSVSLKTFKDHIWHDIGWTYGKNVSNYECVISYKESPMETSEDKLFLLNFEQLNTIYNNYEALGDYLGTVNDNDAAFMWWLRDPSDYTHYANGGQTWGEDAALRFSAYAHDVYESGTISSLGLRPAFYLDENEAVILSGSGLESDPFVIKGKTTEKFEENSLYGYKDNEGNVIVPPKFLKAGDFCDGAALVILPEDPYRLRYIDTNGNYLFDKAFYSANNFSNGYALIVANDKGEYTYIDKTGEAATDLLFEYAEDFNEIFARVILDGQSGVIDTKLTFYPDDINDDYTVTKVKNGYKVNFGQFFEKIYEEKPDITNVRDRIYKIVEGGYTQFADVESEKLSVLLSKDYGTPAFLYSDENYVVTFDWINDALIVSDLIDANDCYVIKREFNFSDSVWNIKIENNRISFMSEQRDKDSNFIRYETVYEEIELTDDLRP